MAIDEAIAVGCPDLQRKGGLRYVGLFDWTDLNGQQITYSGAQHSITGLGASETGVLFEFKDETATLNTNGIDWILGISEDFENVDVNYRNQTFGKLNALEGTTSSAYTEENGITLTFYCRQFCLPYTYTGTNTIDTSAGTMILS